MPREVYWVVSERTEDRYGSADTVEAAGQLARDLLRRGLADGPLSVESGGLVVRQFAVEDGGGVAELTGAEPQTAATQG